MTDEPEANNFEREKWTEDLKLRRQEVALKIAEAERSRWSNPLAIAIFAAAVAGLGNGAVAWVNGLGQRDLERVKSEQALMLEERKAEIERIFQVIKTGNDPDKAAENLRFLLQAGLISDVGRRRAMQIFLDGRKPGQGPQLDDISAACKKFPNLC